LADEPIRILRVIARLNMGGPALHVSYLTRGLAARGYDTTLVSGRLGRGEDSMSYVAEGLGVEALHAPQLSREVSPLHDPQSIAFLARTIRRLRPHILHTHTAMAGAVGRAAALVSGSARPPVIVHTFHGHVLHGYFDSLRTRAFLEAERALARSTTRLIAVSPEVRDDLVSLGVAPAEKFSVIRLGIDLSSRVDAGEGRADLRRLFGIPEDRFVIGWIGRMTGIKRVPQIIEAFSRLRAAGVEATLCLVGSGPDREAVEKLAHELGVMRDILFVGYQRDVAPYYDLFDTLVLASANEGTPVVAIEALAAGTPVVSTNVGGVADVVDDGRTGLLVPADDAEALAQALATLARDPERRAQFGRAGREIVPARYAVERLLDDTDALYRELLIEQGVSRKAA
jgi:glycosyltransferase involved in cell wall biosynthesis